MSVVQVAVLALVCLSVCEVALAAASVDVAMGGWGGPKNTCGDASKSCGSQPCWSSCSSQGGCSSHECCCDRPFCSCANSAKQNTTWHYGPPKFTMTAHIEVERLDDDNPGLRRKVTVHHDSEQGLEYVAFDSGMTVLSNYEAGKAFHIDPTGLCHEHLLDKSGKRHGLFKMQWRSGMTLYIDGPAATASMSLTDGDLPESYTAYDKNNQREFAHVLFTEVKREVDPSVFTQPSGCQPSFIVLDREAIIYQPHTNYRRGKQFVV